MHRSGTSAMAGSLHKVGVSFGRSIMPPSYDNPLGFYENYKLQELNDEILQCLDRSWDDTRPMPENWRSHASLAPLYQKASTILKNEFSSKNCFGIKDPRVSLTLPFWEQVLASHNIQIIHLIMIRSVDEIAASLQKRNFLSLEKAHTLSWYYLLCAEKHSRTKRRIIVGYEQLIRDPTKIIDHLMSSFQLMFNADLKKGESIVNADLKNHNVETIDLSTDQSEISKMSRQQASLLYNILIDGKKDDLDYTEERTLLNDSWNNYQSLSEEFHYKMKNSFDLMSKVLFDAGNGFSERSSQILPVKYGVQNLIFSLDYSLDKIRRIKLLALPIICDLEILEVKIEPNDITFELSENSSSSSSTLFKFDKDPPIIILDFSKSTYVHQITFVLNYLKKSEDIHLEFTTTSKSNPWLTAVGTAVTHPIRLLKNVNVKNLRILRSALKRENPKQILKNFKKLLIRPETQKNIEQLSSGNRSAVLGNQPLKHSQVIVRKASNSRAQKLKIKTRVLYITPSLPEYDTSSGGRRAVQQLSLLTNHHEVYVFTSGTQNARYVKDLESRGIKIIQTTNTLKVKEELSFVHALIYAWYFTWEEQSSFREIYPGALTIIDSVDINWVREERSINIWDGTDEKRAAKNKKQEIEAYAAADDVWVVSQPDKDAILSELPNCSISIVSNIHEIIKHEYIDPGSNNILFIGGYNHYPNLSAVQTLATDIFPKVLGQIPDAQLFIAGSNAPEEVAALGGLTNTKFLGLIPEEQIRTLYDQVLLSVAPLKTGAGVKGKITEAIAYGVPVVTNHIGNEGIGLIHGESGLIVENIGDMAAEIVEAMKRSYDLKKITSNAQQLLKSLSDPKIALRSMTQSLERPVMICIVTWNNLELLRSCIDSIFKETVYHNYAIAVYSNGCSDGTQDYLKELDSQNDIVSCVLADQNDVYVRPNNTLMKLYPKHDIVLLNNDVTVTKNWLRGLYNSAYINEQIGITGSKILYPDGRLQEFGSELYEDGTGRNIGKWDTDPYDSDYDMIKAVGYVSGCAMFIKRSTLDKVGYFDEDFHPCYCEDSDLCYRAWKHELQTIVTPDSVIYHHEGATAGKEDDEGYKQYQTLHMDKFLTKHKPSLKATKNKIKKANKRLKSINIA